MGDVGSLLSFAEHFVFCVEGKADRTDTHGRAIAPAVVWLRMVGVKPVDKRPAVFRSWIASANLAHLLLVRIAREDRIGHCNGQDSVVCESTPRMEEREILGLDLVLLIDRADDVSGNCSNHISSSLCRTIEFTCEHLYGANKVQLVVRRNFILFQQVFHERKTYVQQNHNYINCYLFSLCL